MRDSLMLSSLTVGEKQHPKLGGCVRVFFQLFDWNRRLSCKKRVFSQKQLPAERQMRSKYMKEGRGASSPFISTDVEPVLLITNGEEEDNGQPNIMDCSMEIEIEGKDRTTSSDDTLIHEAVPISSHFSSTRESINESAQKVKGPGAIGRLMGLDSLPSPQCENKKKKVSPCNNPPVHIVDPSPPLQTPASLIISPADYEHQHKVHSFALEHGLPEEELNALISELNGSICTILSALPPSTSRTHSTSRMNLTIGASPPSSTHSATITRTHVNTTSGSSSPSSTCPATLIRTHVNTTTGASSPSSTCPATVGRTHVNTTTGASPSSTGPATVAWTHVKATNGAGSGRLARTSVDISNAPVSRGPKLHPERQELGAELVERKVICSREDLSEFEQQIFNCPEARDGNVGTVKREKKVKGKRSTAGLDGERIPEIKGVNASIDGASYMEMKPHEELAEDMGRRTTCKSGRRKKIDREIEIHELRVLQEEVRVRGLSNDQYRQEEGGVQRGLSLIEQTSCSTSARGTSNDQYKQQEEGGRRGYSSKYQALQHSEQGEGGVQRGYSLMDQTSCSSERGSSNDQCRQPEGGGRGGSEEGGAVRGSLINDQTSCSTSVGILHNQHLSSSSLTNFDVKYDEGYFDEYHKSKGSLVPASKFKHLNDQGNGKTTKKSIEAEIVAAAHHMDHSLECRNFAAAESKHEESCLMRLLIKRRAAREAAAAAAIEATGILETESPTVDKSAVACTYAGHSLHGIVCSSSVQLDTTDLERREKLSAGRSETGSGDFTQITRPIISVEHSAAAGRCICREESCPGNDYGCVQDSRGGNIAVSDRMARSRCTTLNARAHDRALCMQGAASVVDSAAGGMSAGGLQLEVCSGHTGSGKHTTAAILQDVICALNANHCTPQSTPVSNRPRHHQQSDDDGGSPTTADTESTWDSGGCSWAAASQPSPVSVLVSPFDDDASPAGDHDKNTCWIQSEEDYVAALLAATSDSEPTILPPAELFSKLEERVETTWSDSEILPTRGYRRLVFDCVCEALGEAAAYKEGKGNRRWRARVLFEEMCRWRQDACEIVLDDLVEADLGKPCNRWSSFEVQTRDIALLLERTIFGLLLEELVCDLVLNVAS